MGSGSLSSPPGQRRWTPKPYPVIVGRARARGTVVVPDWTCTGEAQAGTTYQTAGTGK
jgi:hypothetical protein